MPDTIPTAGSIAQAPSTVSISPMATLQLTALLPFSLADSTTLGQHWSRWVQPLEYRYFFCCFGNYGSQTKGGSSATPCQTRGVCHI